MFGMEMEAERRREVIAGAIGDGRRYGTPVRSENRRWRASPEVSAATARPRRCDEALTTTGGVRG